jgi:hypothetical protein
MLAKKKEANTIQPAFMEVLCTDDIEKRCVSKGDGRCEFSTKSETSGWQKTGDCEGMCGGWMLSGNMRGGSDKRLARNSGEHWAMLPLNGKETAHVTHMGSSEIFFLDKTGKLSIPDVLLCTMCTGECVEIVPAASEYGLVAEGLSPPW